jgi:hypothetical protein
MAGVWAVEGALIAGILFVIGCGAKRITTKSPKLPRRGV